MSKKKTRRPNFTKIVKMQERVASLASLRGQAATAIDDAVKQFSSCISRIEAITNKSSRPTPKKSFPAFRHFLDISKNSRELKSIAREVETSRDMFRSATLVLIEAMRASDMPHESLKHLFTPERCRIEFLRNDVKILIGAYLPLGEILRSKLKSIEHFIQLYKDTSVKQTAVSVPQYARDAYRSYVQAIQENPALANADFPEVHQWIKDHGVELDKRPYDLPDFKTWRRYRSEGERFAKPASE